MKCIQLIFYRLAFTDCIAQNSDRQFSKQQIDSIVLADNYRYIMSDSGINVEISNIDGKNTNGKGGSSTTSYLWHFDKENYNKLTREERKKYPIYKKSILIRAEYHETIHFDNDYSIETTATFYYANCNHLFFVGITKTTFYKDKKKSSYTFEIDNPGINSEYGNELVTEFENLIEEKNEEIIKKHSELYTCK